MSGSLGAMNASVASATTTGGCSGGAAVRSTTTMMASSAGRQAGRLRTAAAAATATDVRRAPRPQNVDGDFYVDHTCIDCDTCRWMAPDSFTRVDDQAAVTRQPQTSKERVKAMQALLSCPTSSIHCQNMQKGEVKNVEDTFPIPVKGCPNIYHTGFHSKHTFGGASYIIVRKEGNIMVDVPRYNAMLARKVTALGGIKWMFLTHSDDVFGHEKWANHFGAKRIIHKLEANTRQGTDQCEVKLDGKGPWYLDDGDDVEMIFTPGHTAGSVTLFHKPTKTMLTGDHLGVDIWTTGEPTLSMFSFVRPSGKAEQLENVKKLVNYDFLHILPGHGRRRDFMDAASKHKDLMAVDF